MKTDRYAPVTAGMTVFSLLYASTVIGTPLYRGGHTLLRFGVTALLLAVYTPFAVSYFSARGRCPRNGVAVVFSAVFAVCAAAAGAGAVTRFVDPLVTFAPYYDALPVRLAAGAAVVLCALYAAYHGARAVTGLASVIAWLFPLWTGTGLFAFLTTKTILPPSPPFAGADAALLADAVLGALPLLADVTIVTMRLGDSRTDGRRVSRGIVGGMAAFLLLAAVNIVKNLLLLGETFAGETDVPNLAAIRLVPMLELPETAVIVGMAAAVVRCAVYAEAALAFCGKSGGIVFSAALTAGAAGCVLLRFVPRAGGRTEAVTAALALLAAYASHIDGKIRKQTEKSDTV